MHSQPRTALQIAVPKRAPTIEQISVRDAELATLSKRVLGAGTSPLLDQTLNETDLRVYGLFAAHCDNAGITSVSQGRIARLMCRSQQLVSKSYDRLVKRGHIKKGRKPGKNGHAQNVTRLLIDASLTDADARSISNAPQHNHHHQKVVIEPTTSRGSESALSTDLSTVTTPQCNPITTRIDQPQLLPPGSSRNVEVYKTYYNGVHAEELLNYWQSRAHHYDIAVVPNDEDLAIASELEVMRASMDQAAKAIETHYSDVEAFNAKPHLRLKPIVSGILSPVQSSNGRLRT
jgi:hypothetical protein